MVSLNFSGLVVHLTFYSLVSVGPKVNNYGLPPDVPITGKSSSNALRVNHCLSLCHFVSLCVIVRNCVHQNKLITCLTRSMLTCCLELVPWTLKTKSTTQIHTPRTHT